MDSLFEDIKSNVRVVKMIQEVVGKWNDREGVGEANVGGGGGCKRVKEFKYHYNTLWLNIKTLLHLLPDTATESVRVISELVTGLYG